MKEQASVEEKIFFSEEQAEAIFLWYLNEILGKKDKNYPLINDEIEPEIFSAKKKLNQLLGQKTTDSARLAIRELGIFLYELLTDHSERTDVSFCLDGYPAVRTYNATVSQKFSRIIQLMIAGYFRNQEALKEAFENPEQVEDVPEAKEVVQGFSWLKEKNLLEVKDLLDPEAVIKALTAKGFEIELSEEEKAKFQQIPFSEETLRIAGSGQWRGTRAILWWAPPERCGVTMLKLRELFGTSKNTQPCVYNNDWWLNAEFAKKILREGWHLTLTKMPTESKNQNYEEQKALLAEKEELPEPVEVMYFCLVNYLINDKERLLHNDYSGTNTLLFGGSVVCLGRFRADGFDVGSSPPDRRVSCIGILPARKFD